MGDARDIWGPITLERGQRNLSDLNKSQILELVKGQNNI